MLGVLLAFLPAAVIGARCTVHQERAVRDADGDLRDADHRRHRAAVRGPDEVEAAVYRRHAVPAARWRSRSASASARDDPGVSRSGATIVGAMLLGADKRSGGGVLVLPRHADHGRRLRL